MLHALGSLPARVYPVLDWFIPEKLKADAERLRRIRTFLVSHLFGPFLGHTISIFILLLQPRPTLAWFIFFGAIALKLTGWYVPLALLSVQNLIFCILWGCYQYGGLSSPLLPWVITVPLLAFFYLGSGRWPRVFVISIIVTNLFLLFVFSDSGRSFPQNIPLSSLSGLGIISTICAAAYLSMMALYYGSIVSSQSELEREVLGRLETAERLREATREAERANQAKSEFLAKMSHELRTPLNAVIGYSAILLEDAEVSDREQQCLDLRKIQDAGEHLLSLINDLLDLSKLDAGKMELYIETIDLPSLVADVAAGLRGRITGNGNTLRVECQGDLVGMQADATKLAQALSNLVGNAAKFTRNGHVAVTARGDGRWVEIAVRDNGIGIDRRRVATLFENFDEDESATTSRYGGTGLGLALSRKLVVLMGGDLLVESELGQGSCFTVRLPFTRASETLALTAHGSDSNDAAQRPPDKTVLVIDDDPSVLDLLNRLLAKEGYAPVVAGGGFEGLELTRRLLPPVIILDVQMPEPNGWQVLKAIRSDPKLDDCNVVMLSVDDNLQQARPLGAQDYLVKPVNPQALMEVIGRLHRGPRGVNGRTEVRADALA
jgi:signal transduction histidine kinase/CheY-like chemotaxis protein